MEKNIKRISNFHWKAILKVYSCRKRDHYDALPSGRVTASPMHRLKNLKSLPLTRLSSKCWWSVLLVTNLGWKSYIMSHVSLFLKESYMRHISRNIPENHYIYENLTFLGFCLWKKLIKDQPDSKTLIYSLRFNRLRQHLPTLVINGWWCWCQSSKNLRNILRWVSKLGSIKQIDVRLWVTQYSRNEQTKCLYHL